MSLCCGIFSRSGFTITELDIQKILVVVAFSSLVRILGECSTNHSLPVCFLFYFLRGDKLAHINSTVYARISP